MGTRVSGSVGEGDEISAVVLGVDFEVGIGGGGEDGPAARDSGERFVEGEGDGDGRALTSKSFKSGRRTPW